MATKLQRLPRLLLLFPIFLVGHTTASLSQSHERDLDLDVDRDTAASGLHPVVLLPGSTCSQIEARLTDAYEPPSTSPLCRAPRGGDDGRWSRLWKNGTALEADVPCLADQLRLVYDLATGDYRNAPGVHTRALSFGSTRGFLSDNPADRDLCMGRLVEALEKAGYRDGETLFGAPYDFRHAPAAPGLPSAEFSRFRRRLTALVERASRRNGDRPAILVSHSQGGYFALEFLNRSPPRWRRSRVKHFVMASTGAGGFVLAMKGLTSYVGSVSSPADVLSLSRVRRTFPSAFTALPSPTVFADNTPLVVTETRNYTARDMPEFLAEVVGFPPYAVSLYETRALPVALGFRATAVPVTCVNGVGVSTAERLVYREGGAEPEVVYGDGDGVVNLASILALDTVIGGDPAQGYYKSVKIANMSHRGVVSDGLALERLVSEILDANRAVDTYAI